MLAILAMLARHMTLLGVSDEQGHVLVRLVHVLSRVPEANPYALALGAGVLIVTTGIARISSRVHGALIGLVGAGLAVALFHLGGRGVSLLGALSLPLPHLALLSPLATSLHDSGCGLLDPEHRPYLCD